ncbi:protein Hook homolog 3-like isoform X2 [Amphiprion ocellaris]|uniref:protein Hook homolog 3-like isoform X2 n=1 Tax=Amphiprion ocellaris TaxID=80972 RepID=UPI002410E9CB|nr:protein Hook homolog 3-like isoform X2 [Amphiprion ocellaris]
MSSKKEAGLLAAASEDLQSDKTRMRQEQEERLILTAWQNMNSLSEDSRAPGLPQSFLARQRQSTQARRALSPRLEPR